MIYQIKSVNQVRVWSVSEPGQGSEVEPGDIIIHLKLPCNKLANTPTVRSLIAHVARWARAPKKMNSVLYKDALGAK